MSESPSAGGRLPRDLSLAMDERDVLDLVLDAVQTVEWPRPVRNFRSEEGVQLRPQMLLTLLVYCYATGVFSADEIEAHARQNRTMRYLCAGTTPTAYDLRRFRRQHRDQIKVALTKLLGSVVTAEERLSLAILLDSVASDV